MHNRNQSSHDQEFCDLAGIEMKHLRVVEISWNGWRRVGIMQLPDTRLQSFESRPVTYRGLMSDRMRAYTK